MFFRSIVDEALSFEIEEDYQVFSKGVEVSEGNVKQVFEGLRPEIIKYAAHDDDRFSVHSDLNDDAQVVNTFLYQDYDLDIMKQDFVPDTFFEAAIEHGIDHAVGEAVRIEESFLENGYVYRDLKPENIRFHSEVGMAVDYLDRLSVQKVENTEDLETALAKSYDLFVSELSEIVHGLEPVEAEKLVDKHSNYTEAWNFTGEPYIDFRYTG